MSLGQRDTPPQAATLSALLRELLKICLAIGIAFLQYMYAAFVGLYLFEKVGAEQKLLGSGTVHGVVAWTIPIRLPGTIALDIAREYHQQPGDFFTVLALSLFLAGSLLTSYVIASFAIKPNEPRKKQFRALLVEGGGGRHGNELDSRPCDLVLRNQPILLIPSGTRVRARWPNC